MPMMMAGIIAGRIIGTVMFQNECHPDEPSTSAASYSSRGMLCNAPVAMAIMNGQPSQTLVMRTA